MTLEHAQHCATCHGHQAVLESVPIVHPHLSQRLGMEVYGVRMQHAGYAHPDKHSITLREGLTHYLVHPTVSHQTANALAVATHEIGHVVLQSNDENKVNNYMQAHFKLMALRLGMTRTQARALERINPFAHGAKR